LNQRPIVALNLFLFLFLFLFEQPIEQKTNTAIHKARTPSLKTKGKTSLHPSQITEQKTRKQKGKTHPILPIQKNKPFIV